MSSLEEKYCLSRGRSRGRSRGTWIQSAFSEQEKIQATASLGRVDTVVQEGTAADCLEQYPVQQVQEMKLSSGDSTSRGAYRKPSKYNADFTRPERIVDKQGESGKKIDVVANFFQVISRPQWLIYQYHVDFSPQVESSLIRRSLLITHTEKMGPCFLFDGMSDLKTMLNMGPSVTLFSCRDTDGEKIQIQMKKTQELTHDHPEILRLFNTMMRKNLHQLDFVLLGKHYFDKKTAHTISRHRLEVWQGVVTSIQQYENSLMMSVDTIHKVLRQDTVLEQMRQIRNQHGEYKANCSRALLGAIVMTLYNNKTYRINDINWEATPKQTFNNSKGDTISYITYYKKQYDVNIHDEGQPLLVCESKEKEVTKTGKSQIKHIHLIPELCIMTGLTESMRTDFQLMQDLAQQTRLSPAQRVQSLNTFMRRITSSDKIQEDLSGWGVKFDTRVAEISARVLPSETLSQKDYSFQVRPGTADFQGQMRGRSLHCTAHLKNWLVFFTNREEPNCRAFVGKLREACNLMGVQLIQPYTMQVKDDKTSSYLEKMDECLTPDTEFVLFVLPNDRKERYDAIKKKVCIEKPIPSQVVLARTISKPQILMSVASKIALQINSKLGGAPWIVDIPLKQCLMVIGFDAYHDSSRKGSSVGAFVASLNNPLTKWFSQVDFNKAGEWKEMSENFQKHLKVSLIKFQTNNGKLPDAIIFYRSGISDGQIKYVLEWEVEQIENIFNEISCNYTPAFSYIIVNKTISTRFFKRQGESYTNPDPGTVIDNVVTKPQRYDFFLVSQSVRQGTVSPTHYNIIYDTTTLKPEHMQRLTYKLTHLYYNWPGTIRVPAPCQYAHKLAFLVGQSLHKPFHTALSDRLFYL